MSVRKLVLLASAAVLAAGLGVGLCDAPAQAASCRVSTETGGTWGSTINKDKGWRCQAVQVRLYHYWGGGVGQHWDGPEGAEFSYRSTGGPTAHVYYFREKVYGSWSGWIQYHP